MESEEQAQKPMADASLIGEISRWARHYLHSDMALADSDLQDILCKYTPMPDTDKGGKWA